jgi:hypothetical protein
LTITQTQQPKEITMENNHVPDVALSVDATPEGHKHSRARTEKPTPPYPMTRGERAAMEQRINRATDRIASLEGYVTRRVPLHEKLMERHARLVWFMLGITGACFVVLTAVVVALVVR